MKQMKRARSCLAAVALTTMVAAMTASAAAPALNGRIVLRPLTPGDISVYKLPSTTETSSGLGTVGIGMPVYLEAEVNSAIASSDIVSVTWAIASQPLNSLTYLTNSPLGAAVPVYEPVDRSSYQVAGRSLLRPDVTGQYTVTATIVTTGSGTATVTNTITAGTYMGLNTCKLCHSGGEQAEDKYHPWSGTAHSMIFSNGINGYLGSYSASCLRCHTVGYDPNTNAIVNPVNGGFDDIMKQTGWKFPSVLAPTNWAAMPASLRNVANIQCENCHGPGSQHAYNLGDTNLISKTALSGACNQCHDAPTHHIKGTEWYNSRHAVAVEETEASCSRCHTAKGFENYAAGAPATATPYEVITCVACHEPHDASNTNQLRTLAPVTLMDKKTTITKATAGKGLLCMNCHMSRRDATNYVEVTAGSNRYGPHHGPQADMLVGANAVNYGKEIPSSAHRSAVGDACVTCHMQTVTDTNILTHVGGHTFSPSWDNGTNTVELTDACVQCHGPISSFNFARQDYDGNGIVEGVQTEVRGLLSTLAMLLPPVGVAKTNHSPSNISITSSWTKPQLRAGYNYLFVVEDGSYGIHNLSYAVGLIKASIADLTGNPNATSMSPSDVQFYTWQVQYFGSATDPKAAPNATPANDGIPNWLKYSLGLNPLIPGVAVPGGVVWANGNKLGGSAPTNTVQIYTAAEVTFDTIQGTTYQVQENTSLNSGWQNVGDPIPGTGNAISYVTPTRQNVQQYFRVVHTP
jgi:hypothetical protein